MDDTKTFDGEIAASGVIRVENKTTGKYTLVGCIYDAEGAMQGYTFISFGYIAKGDAKPVILTMGLRSHQRICRTRYHPRQLGEVLRLRRRDRVGDIRTFPHRPDRRRRPGRPAGCFGYGLYRRAARGAQCRTFQHDAHGTERRQRLHAAAACRKRLYPEDPVGDLPHDGHLQPALDSFEYTDFLSARQQPSIDRLTGTTWNYYAMDIAGADERRFARRSDR